MKNLIFVIVALAVLAAGCIQSTQDPNAAKLEEISRLTSLAAKGNMTAGDFQQLKQLVAGDANAQHEIEEMEVLAGYREYEHIAHSLGFLGAYISTGRESLCPAHMLAHYYVFERHGETELADGALEEAKQQLPEWIPLATAYNEKYPSGQSVARMTDLINFHMEQIDNGNTSASDEEINFLANRGICVQAE